MVMLMNKILPMMRMMSFPIIDSFKELASAGNIEVEDPLFQSQNVPLQIGVTVKGFSDKAASQTMMQDDSFPSAIFDLALNHKSPPLTLFTQEALNRIRYGENIKYPKCPT